MGLIVDIIEEHATLLEETPSLLINETFMMGSFSEYDLELLTFNEYLNYIYTENINIVQSKIVKGTFHINSCVWSYLTLPNLAT